MLPLNLRRSRPFTSIVTAVALLAPALIAAQACSDTEEGATDPCAGDSRCGEACSTAEPCPAGYFCGTDGRCTRECTPAGNQCGSGEECAGGRCVPDDGITLEDGGTNYEGGSVPLDDAGHGELADAACTGWTAEPEPMPAVLMLVVDVSGSMTIPDPTDETQSKWEVTQRALLEAVAALPATTSVGMLFYPNMATDEGGERDVTECVDVDALIPPAALGGPDAAQRLLLQDALETTAPNRQAGTPTHDAYVTALEALQQSPALGEKYMLVITDGQPTFLRFCNGSGLVSEPVDEQPIIDEIAAARQSSGIDTFLIGSPGSEQNESTGDDARPWLSHAAEAGGTALAGCTHEIGNFCHFDMVEEENFSTGLRNALGQIAGQIVSCEYPLPVPPAGESLDLAAVNVVMTDGSGAQTLLLRDVDPDCAVGWHYSEDGSQVLLCSDSCAAVKADPRAALELMFGCATREGPIQ